MPRRPFQACEFLHHGVVATKASSNALLLGSLRVDNELVRKDPYGHGALRKETFIFSLLT